MARATIIHFSKFFAKHKYFETEAVVELKIWSIPVSKSFPEGIKYALFCVNKEFNEIVVGFDNHHPKGHHMHIGSEESEYSFESVDRLIKDFFDMMITQGYEL
ncbi:MAG TPA: DUF6516 family protein [Bacteriovoracaceae bacterium]|nr:DUF6516 family protein [Bacteriovoracaceae bacterium]